MPNSAKHTPGGCGCYAIGLKDVSSRTIHECGSLWYEFSRRGPEGHDLTDATDFPGLQALIMKPYKLANIHTLEEGLGHPTMET